MAEPRDELHCEFICEFIRSAYEAVHGKPLEGSVLNLAQLQADVITEIERWKYRVEELENRELNLIKEARVIILNGGHPGDSVVDQWLADTEQWHTEIPCLSNSGEVKP